MSTLPPGASMPVTCTKQATLGIHDHHIVDLATALAVTTPVFVHQDMAEGFLSLHQAAKAEGLDICIASGFRNFERQLAIWNAKFEGLRSVYDKQQRIIDMDKLDDWQKVQAILTYSALPGTSRHHWGTDIDVYDRNAIEQGYQLQLTPEEYTTGPFRRLSDWLTENSKTYQFFLPYQRQDAGIAHEPWHLSYQPVAMQFEQTLQQNPSWLTDHLATTEIAGKQAIIEHIEVIFSHYVFNISKFNQGANL